ncbi:MAG: DNA topoisomerase I, partial [Verrucomicrobia bacterium]|nr:DNA topoisomerase I [Cytophagales bacterium]
RRYKTKNENAQEAHEAIRPTDFSVQTAGNDRNEQRLYDLIWKRAIASQMADAQLERTTATVGIKPTQAIANQFLAPNGDLKENLIASGEVIKFDGFLKVYLESSDDDDEESKTMLPPLNIGQLLDLRQMRATERFTRPSPRYTEASLVKKLEELGIGRPSTYAPTISTILKRGYVVKEDRDGKPRKFRELVLEKNIITDKTDTETVGTEKSKLFPTDVASVVNDFLVQYFPTVIDFSFTANVEKEFDEIASGKRIWVDMIDDFYQEFHKKVEDSQEIKRSDAGGSRALGNHPENGEPMFVKLGKFGPYVQIGDTADETKKPKFASLKKTQRMETISIEDALELFKLPREIGFFEEKAMKVAIGRFGPYVQHDSKYFSLGKDDDPFEIEESRGVEIIEAKRKADAEKYIKEFPENTSVKVLNGRYGPYIVVGEKNVKIPKGIEPQNLTLQECLKLAEEAPEKKTFRRFPKTAATAEKKAATKKVPVKKAVTKKTVATKPKASATKPKTAVSKPKKTVVKK